jgi:glycosyltransferase involved in cell wall biosynthesis
MPKKTILATAYAINPYKGSEDGMGWNFILQIAKFNRVIAITRENNQEQIEKYILENPDPSYQNIRFLYYDLPFWMRFWKKGNRGAMLYYVLWQYGIVNFIRKQKLYFDIAHNLNFHNDWTPSFLWKLKKPFVWGPIGHHPRIPSQYLRVYSLSSKISNMLTWVVKKYFWNFSYALYQTKTKADHILCMNASVPSNLSLKSKFSIAPSVATQDFGWNPQNINDDTFNVISAGRFVSLKGFDLTVESYATFIHTLSQEDRKKCNLYLVGSGPEEALLRKLIIINNISSYVQIISWTEREELLKKFKASSVFLFPSHEGAGMVVAEALSFGLPVICLDNDGPGKLIDNSSGYAVPQSNYEDTVQNLAQSLIQLFHNKNKRKDMSLAARQRFLDIFHWDRRGEQLKEIYATL